MRTKPSKMNQTRYVLAEVPTSLIFMGVVIVSFQCSCQMTQYPQKIPWISFKIIGIRAYDHTLAFISYGLVTLVVLYQITCLSNGWKVNDDIWRMHTIFLEISSLCDRGRNNKVVQLNVNILLNVFHWRSILNELYRTLIRMDCITILSKVILSLYTTTAFKGHLQIILLWIIFICDLILLFISESTDM